jgi:hypothetical protein
MKCTIDCLNETSPNIISHENQFSEKFRLIFKLQLAKQANSDRVKKFNAVSVIS